MKPTLPILTMLMSAKLLTARVIYPDSKRNPSVHYILSNHGNFFVASGRTMTSESSTMTKPAKSSCHCKQMCRARVPCVAWSFVFLDGEGGAECRMADKGPTAYDLQDHPNATYYFMEDSIKGDYSFKADDLLYLKPDFIRVYDVAKSFCERIPGHRLGMYKTNQQMSFLNDYLFPSSPQESMMMHLEKSPKGMVWGDGTLFADTEVSKEMGVVEDNDASLNIFLLYYGSLNDVDPSRSRHFMCQANPLGVPW